MITWHINLKELKREVFIMIIRNKDILHNITSLIVMKKSYQSIILGYTQAIENYYNSWTDFLREVNSQEFDLYADDEDNL